MRKTILALCLFVGLLPLTSAAQVDLSPRAPGDTPAHGEPRAGPPTETPGSSRGPLDRAADPRGQGAKAGADAAPAAAAKSTAEGPAQRRQALQDLYAHLASAGDADATVPLVAAIERIWLYSGSDTVDLLMERVLKAIKEQDLDLAAKLTDTIVELEPGFPEGWNRKALVAYLRNDYADAMDALRRVLALEPSHFKALDGLAQVLSETGEKKAALGTYRRLLDVHPYWEGAQEAMEKLERDVEGQGI